MEKNRVLFCKNSRGGSVWRYLALVSFTQTPRETSDENRLRRRGFGENVNFIVTFLIGAKQLCDANHSQASGWSCEGQKEKCLGVMLEKIECF